MILRQCYTVAFFITTYPMQVNKIHVEDNGKYIISEDYCAFAGLTSLESR